MCVYVGCRMALLQLTQKIVSENNGMQKTNSQHNIHAHTHSLTHTVSLSLSLSPSQWTSRGLEKFTNTSSESDRQRGTQMTTKEFFNIAVRCVYAPSAKTNKIKQSDRVANSHCVWQCGREKNAAREGEEIRLKWGRRKRAS